MCSSDLVGRVVRNKKVARSRERREDGKTEMNCKRLENKKACVRERLRERWSTEDMPLEC